MTFYHQNIFIVSQLGILKRFLTDDIKIKAITDIFTGLYSMDSNTDEGQNALRMVLTDPAK